MKKQGGNNFKLGLFVMAGLLFLVLLLYMIGKNRNIFGATYILNARFDNVQGLLNGNNVRYSGIQAGTVNSIKILNDTTIEVGMSISSKMRQIIKKNAVASIGTDGLVGNKVINIVPGKSSTQGFAQENDIIFSKKAFATEEILETLNKTNNDVAVIASNLKTTIQRINTSNGLWELLEDNTIPNDVKKSIANIRKATLSADQLVNNINGIFKDVKTGKGDIGKMLYDTSIVGNLNIALHKLEKIGTDADILVREINNGVIDLKNDIGKGKGTINVILKDSVMAGNINASLANIQKGTDGFNQNMEALKDNFFFRRHYRKLEKQKKKEELEKGKIISK